MLAIALFIQQIFQLTSELFRLRLPGYTKVSIIALFAGKPKKVPPAKNINKHP